MRLLLVLCLAALCSPFYSFSQSTATDSLCCSCLKTNPEELEKVIRFKNILREIDPDYIQLVQSLAENIDVIQYEKFTYLLKLDKYLKYEVHKKIYAYEGRQDSLSVAVKQELERLIDVLAAKSSLLNLKVESCEKQELIQHYVRKKNIINSLEADYYMHFISLINSTIDEERRDYPQLLQLDRGLLEKLQVRRQALVDRVKKSAADSLNLALTEELIGETRERITRIEVEQLGEKLVSKDKLEAGGKLQETFYLKELIMNSDTLRFGFNGTRNEKQVIVANNTMYVFRNDSLVETIKNEDNSQLASIFDNRKPISVDNYDDLFYTIQIGAYSREMSARDLKVKSNLFYKRLPNGMIRYSFGMFNDLEEVDRAKKLLESIGITDMIVIAYYHKEKITLKEAKRIKNEELRMKS